MRACNSKIAGDGLKLSYFYAKLLFKLYNDICDPAFTIVVNELLLSPIFDHRILAPMSPLVYRMSGSSKLTS